MVSEEILVEGHIIDSLILSKILDEILQFGGDFRLKEVHVGQRRDDRSQALIEVQAPDANQLGRILNQISKHGATFRTPEDVHLIPAEQAGVFPEGFYSTTNQRTLVRYQGQWLEVRKQEMDCGIRYNPAEGTFECVPVIHIRAGDLIVVGHRGVKVIPLERSRELGTFEFMSSNVSTEKPKNVIIHDVAQKMRSVKEAGGKILLVGGPAIVHTGSVRHVVRLIEEGFVRILFAGNALATHDIELALFGTSLGVHMDRAIPADTGHEHHLRAINTIRRYGSIRAAVEAGVVTSGIMHACIRHNVDFVLAGSIRDDGPLPEVITDVLVAQDRMREFVPEVGFALMVATTLHSVATGNLLPAWVPVVCVDISPSTVTKLSDRGTFQTVGVVTDVEPFFRELLSELGVS
ncbi:MAG TPA: TIGR00300 family protein [Phycisphaerae bacterium]|jgi:lysine-ketoglutarate reductase/saccharopine dehydrogenase-like protein (TIGR00300 family)|nr:TIGR00300 family protein [Phycisphaerae bacterium]HOB73342.1 TIGR00300 family protein [Phycisphaerae bacterium]HOJ55223.1 TIGR00300 family protein [Phycisphaerae bacterium]HOL24984.1 TIGR00300 family protein [Phycisphaerae bacterium]HPP20086.1 TIGR00300 family protein [Phycisphaerae bacterium]